MEPHLLRATLGSSLGSLMGLGPARQADLPQLSGLQARIQGIMDDLNRQIQDPVRSWFMNAPWAPYVSQVGRGGGGRVMGTGIRLALWMLSP